MPFEEPKNCIYYNFKVPFPPSDKISDGPTGHFCFDILKFPLGNTRRPAGKVTPCNLHFFYIFSNSKKDDSIALSSVIRLSMLHKYAPSGQFNSDQVPRSVLPRKVTPTF